MAQTEVSRFRWFVGKIKTIFNSIWQRYRQLNRYGKMLIWFLILFYISLGIAVFIITPARVSQFAYDKATELSKTNHGWLVLAAVIMAACCPPLVGHSTSVTLAGFAFKTKKGFLLASSSSLVGATIVFVLLRAFAGRKLRSLSNGNEKWQALETVIKEKGLPLIILIRVSPIPPWVYSNVMFASIESVSLWQFCVATLFVFPKLLVQCFIGSTLSTLADGDQRGKMDTQTKIIQGIAIVVSIIISVVVSTVIYRLLTGHLRYLEGLPHADDGELAAEALENFEEFDEDAPLLRSHSPTN